ncbi:HNH endonuclease [Cryobacterium melibiosiphilum]|uniref:HNH endonuclease n=1 Tax=Cryobacterium melibiosiphilum TaxID=995039 RepID=A0A3A5M8Z6_9MICO|nr:HNH endonuclease signature motif containing protein [Cryobacterium melibiosiphilum]RJT84600.1 HNH endonuclease [Cryobacterium melibiosiphilum]
MTSIGAVFEEVTGVLHRCQPSAALFAELSDEESERTHTAISRFVREATTYQALSAANIQTRSERELGRTGLARRKGFKATEELLQSLDGGGSGTRSEQRHLISAGLTAAEAETARLRQLEADLTAAEHPDLPPVVVEVPWFAALGDAVADGTLGTNAAYLIRTGLGEPAVGVTEDMLREALAGLITECRTVNADQAAVLARHARNSIDGAGIASRAEAMRDRQYVRTYTKTDGMLHGDFELDPVNGAFFNSFLLQVTGPRTGGPRFTTEEDKARAEALMKDPRSTGRIRAEFLIEALKVAASANPNEMFMRPPSLNIVALSHPADQPGGTERTEQTKETEQAGQAGQVEQVEQVGQVGPFGHAGTAAVPGRLVVGNGFVEGSSNPAPAAVIETMVCDSGYTPVLFSFDGKPLDVGREQRLFTRTQRQALAVRDGGCMAPGCLLPPSWCEVHHIDLFSTENGQTDIAVGILFGASCHLRIHNDKWKVILKDDVFFMIPPGTADPARTPIRLTSKSPLTLGSPFTFEKWMPASIV